MLKKTAKSGNKPLDMIKGSPVPRRQTIPQVFFPIILVALGMIAGHSFLNTGLLQTGDGLAHLARTKVLFECLKQGILPIWDFKQNYGYSFLQYYGPVYYYLASFFTFLCGGNVSFGNKLLLFCLHVISGIPAYLMMKKLFKDEYSAFIGSVAYLFIPWRLFQIYIMGRMPVALFYSVFPLSIWSALCFIEQPGLKHALFTGLSLSFLVLIHPLYGMTSIIFVFACLVSSIHKSNALNRLKYGILILASAMLLSAFKLIPMALETVQRISTFELMGKDTDTAILSFRVLLTWSDTLRDNWSEGSYMGISLMVLACIGLAVLVKTRRILSFPLALPSLISLFAVAFSGFMYRHFESVMIFSPKRILMFFILFLCVWAAAGFEVLISRVKRKTAVLTAVLAVILLDLMPSAFQTEQMGEDEILGGKKAMYAVVNGNPGNLADLGDPSNRSGNQFNYLRYLRLPAMQQLFSDCPSPCGFYSQFVPKSTGYIAPWLDILAEYLAGGGLKNRDMDSRKAAVLLNLNYFSTFPKAIVDKKTRQVRGYSLKESPLPPWYQWNRDGLVTTRPVVFAKVLSNTPVITSYGIRPWKPDDLSNNSGGDYQELLDSCAFSPEFHSLACLWSKTAAAQAVLPSTGFPEKARVADVAVSTASVKMTVSVNDSCYARLPWSYSPSLEVMINDKPAVFFEGADHFILVGLSKGDNRIRILPRLPFISKLCVMVSLLSFIAALMLIFYRSRSPEVPPG